GACRRGPPRRPPGLRRSPRALRSCRHEFGCPWPDHTRARARQRAGARAMLVYSRAMTTEEWFDTLTGELLARNPFRTSEYFKRFAAGALTREQVWAHIAQHYLLIAWFPRIFSGIHTRCDDFEVRKDCARHLLVEDLGFLNGRVGATPDHDELFRRIGDDLGSARDAYDRIVPVPEMAAIVSFFEDLAHARPWSAALCATALLEEEVVEIARTVGRALVEHYGVRAGGGRQDLRGPRGGRAGGVGRDEEDDPQAPRHAGRSLCRRGRDARDAPAPHVVRGRSRAAPPRLSLVPPSAASDRYSGPTRAGW